MGLFDSAPSTDPSTPGYGYSSPLLLPQVAAAYNNDPRTALVKALLASNQEGLKAFMPSGKAVAGRVLASGLGGLAAALQGKKYEDANADAMKSMQSAYDAAAGPAPTGATGSADPFSVGRALMKNSATAPAALGQLQAYLLKKQDATITDQLELAKQGKMRGPDGVSIVAIPGAPEAVATLSAADKGGGKTGELAATTAPAAITGQAALAGAVKGAETTADVGAKTTPTAIAGQAALEGATKQAGVAPAIRQATGIAAGTAPIDTFKEMFKPVVNRVTGEVSIPGVDDPAMVNTIMQKFGVKPTDLGAPTAPSAATAPGATAPAPTSMATQKPPPPSAAVIAPGAPPAAVAPQLPGAPATAPADATSKAPVPIGTMKPQDEIPLAPLPTGLMTKNAGTISQGRDPIQIKAGEEAVEAGKKQYDEVSEAGKAATQVQSQLGTMQSLLDKGTLITNMSAPIREQFAGLIYAASGGNRDMAFKLTGIDPSAAETYNKESTRLGFSLARTMGAREAAQIVQGAIKANPNLANTVEGNKMVIGLLGATAQHDIDAQTYADAWFNKNGHYVGAQGWFNQNHPVQEYTSKAVPYEVPRLQSGQVDVSKLLPNVTYRGKNGPGIWTPDGFHQVQQ